MMYKYKYGMYSWPKITLDPRQIYLTINIVRVISGLDQYYGQSTSFG